MGRAYNLGSGTGATVLEVLRACEEVSGRPIPHEIASRRPGDPAVLIASPQKIIDELGWSPRYMNIQDIVQTAWNWHHRHPARILSDLLDSNATLFSEADPQQSVKTLSISIAMSLAYLFNWYPMPSQTALRREVVALEELGVSFHRFSLRRYEGELVDEHDRAEREPNSCCP